MSVWMVLAVVFSGLFLLLVLELVYESITAPVLDDDGNVIIDRYHRMPRTP
jgi:hypothetical protein